MVTQLEEIEKDELIKMIKTLWIERKLKDLEIDYPEDNYERKLTIDLIPFFRSAFNLNEDILNHFYYNEK